MKRYKAETEAVVHAATRLMIEPDELAVLERRYGLRGRRACIDIDVIAAELGISGYHARARLLSGLRKLQGCTVLEHAWERLAPADRIERETE